MIYINIKNLKSGQTVKNYKELCEILKITVNTSTTRRKKQLEELSLYVDYHKEGNKFIIDSVIDSPALTLNDILKTKNSKYIMLLSNIILEYLYKHPEELEEISLNKLFEILGITNTNYKHCNIYKKELSQIYEIQLASIYYFYSNTRNEFKRIIERCLNNLKNRSVLRWSSCTMIIDANGVHKASIKEDKQILNAQRVAMNELKVNTVFEAVRNIKTRKEFNDIVKNELNYNYYYTYNIIVGDVAVKIEYDKVKQDQNKVNNLILDRVDNIFSKDIFNQFKDEYELLNNLLINNEYNDSILEELKDKRLKNDSAYNKEIRQKVQEHKNDISDIKEKYKDTYN